MSAQVIDIRTHRPAAYHINGAPPRHAVRQQIDEQVRGYCELLSLTIEQIGLCSAVAVRSRTSAAYWREPLRAATAVLKRPAPPLPALLAQAGVKKAKRP